MHEKLKEGISAGGLAISEISLFQAVAFITCIREYCFESRTEYQLF
jgi:hypothetical protein